MDICLRQIGGQPVGSKAAHKLPPLAHSSDFLFILINVKGRTPSREGLLSADRHLSLRVISRNPLIVKGIYKCQCYA